MYFSVVIPTYNRLPILQKCLRALENQTYDKNIISQYEIVVVDDGSTDNTINWIETEKENLPHVNLYQQNHGGAARARNLGIEKAKGDWILFIDSDVIAVPTLLQAHADSLIKAQQETKGDQIFTYGRLINTANFDNPTAEPYKITDFSAAYFDTANVAILKKWLIKAGKFDADFSQYGWEDLELGVRLKKLGLKLIKCPEALGYHWHPPFSLDQIPQLIDQEEQRGRMGVVFYEKHPSYEVKMMIQMTWLHQLLWGILSVGGMVNENTTKPLLAWLINHGKSQLALEIARIFLNWYNVKAVYQAYGLTKS